MRVSLLIPTYKDIVSLELILEALERQTYRDFEVIVAEDDNSLEVKEFLENYKESNFKIKHVSHENLGNRKAIIMNKALLEAEGEYIIFIDGDTIPFSTFIESHVVLAESKTVLCGRRVNLGDRVSSELREKRVEAYNIEKNYFRLYRYLHNDNIRHYEQGVYIKPSLWIYKKIQSINRNVHIVASNFSCFKEDIFLINGFDEDLPYAPHRDDTDTEWRFVGIGCELVSCKYSANLFHLNHSRSSREREEKINMELINKNRKENRFICKNGIKKL